MAITVLTRAPQLKMVGLPICTPINVTATAIINTKLSMEAASAAIKR